MQDYPIKLVADQSKLEELTFDVAALVSTKSLQPKAYSAWQLVQRTVLAPSCLLAGGFKIYIDTTKKDRHNSGCSAIFHYFCSSLAVKVGLNKTSLYFVDRA